MRARWTLGLLSLLGLATALAAEPLRLEDLAGSYYQGDGLGVNRVIDIGPEGTYSYIWRGCLGIYEMAYGRISLESDGMAMLGPDEDGEGGLSLRVQVVRWGERTYLVSEHDLPRFVDRIKGGDEPRRDRFGWFYLREDDWERPAAGAPDLPAAWADRLGSASSP